MTPEQYKEKLFIAYVNRFFEYYQVALRKPRGQKAIQELGRIYLHSYRDNWVIARDLDLDALRAEAKREHGSDNEYHCANTLRRKYQLHRFGPKDELERQQFKKELESERRPKPRLVYSSNAKRKAS